MRWHPVGFSRLVDREIQCNLTPLSSRAGIGWQCSARKPTFFGLPSSGGCLSRQSGQVDRDLALLIDRADATVDLSDHAIDDVYARRANEIGAEKVVREVVDVIERADLLDHPGDLGRQGHGLALVVGHEDDGAARYGDVMHSFRRYRDLGIKIAFGTNTMPPDMIANMREAIHLCRVAEQRNDALSAAEVYIAATLGAAAALGRDDLGRLPAPTSPPSASMPASSDH